MKKQIILIITITWILSLLTTLAVVYVTSNVLNAQASRNQVQIIKFTESNMKNITTLNRTLGESVASFTYIPENPSSNVILGLVCSLEYNGSGIDMSVRVNNYHGKSVGHHGSLGSWRQVCVRLSGREGVLWIIPNQSNYSITLHAYPHSRESTTYVRNISMWVEVIDKAP